jgi:type VI secretion system secreted protein VgrG
MENVELSFASGEDSLSVRSFVIEERLSALFRAEITARSPHESIDLESIVGQPAVLRMAHGLSGVIDGGPGRQWSGVVQAMELVRVEEAGLSTYRITLVPALWMLTQRSNNRLFQHIAIPDIIDALLGEWDIEARWHVDRAGYPALELRTQYGESDFAFFSRLLEEAGITYHFVFDPERGTELHLDDHPQGAEPRSLPLPFVDSPGQSGAGQIEYVTAVRLTQEVRPGRVTLRDEDFRRADSLLYGEAPFEAGVESQLEHYVHAPGAFLAEQGSKARPGGVRAALGQVAKVLGQGGAAARTAARVSAAVGQRGASGAIDQVQGALSAASQALAMAARAAGADGGATPVADDRGHARFEQKRGSESARLRLEALRADRRVVHFETNALDLLPGMVFQIAAHPRADLGKALLVTAFRIEGEVTQETTMRGTAAFAAVPFRPRAETAKPLLHGVQTAVVVGPSSEEIYTDEFGRVRVQFRWDREGSYDADSSIWMRVSQGWAGAGFGLFTVPRIGHEVLVGFVGGDPDCPLVVGRVFNGAASVPYKLPDHKTVSTWRSESTPGSGGYNEIGFEDAVGRERLYVQAERDYSKVVKNDLQEAVAHNRYRVVQNDERVAVSANRSKIVGASETEVTGTFRSVQVGCDRRTSVGLKDETFVGSEFAVRVAPGLRRGYSERLARAYLWPTEGPVAALVSAFQTAPFGTTPWDATLPAARELFGSLFGGLGNRPVGDDDPGALAAGSATEITMVLDKITLTTGGASITVEGGNITLHASENITFNAGKGVYVQAIGDVGISAHHVEAQADQELTLHSRVFKAEAQLALSLVSRGGDVIVQGAPNVHLNPEHHAGAGEDDVDLGRFINAETASYLVADAGGGGASYASTVQDIQKVKRINQALWDQGLRGHNWTGNVSGGAKCEDVAGALSFAMQQVIGYAGLDGAPTLYIVSFQGNDGNILAYVTGEASHSWVMVRMRYRDGTRYDLHIDNWQGGSPVYSGSPIIADGKGGGHLLFNLASEHARGFASDGALQWALSVDWRARLGM